MPVWLPVAIFLVAVFTVKLIVLMPLQDHPLLQPDAGLDTASYVQLARRVLSGDLALGPGLYYLSPLYIYFLAAVLATGQSFTGVRIVQAAIGTAAVACLFVTAREWFGTRAAWMAGVLAALTGLFTFYEILLLQASLDPFLTSAGLMCLTRALVRGDPQFSPTEGTSRESARWMALLAGAAFGLQTLNRPNVVIAVAGIFAGLAAIRRIRVTAFALAGFIVAVSPIVIRNAIVTHDAALLSSHGGLNFYIGNNAAATGQYVPVPGVRANIEGQSEDTRRIAERALGHPLADSEVSRYFSNLAWTWMRGHPAAETRLLARKLMLVFSAEHQWLDFSYPYYARDLNTALRALIVGPWLLVPLGLIGLVVGAPATNRREYFVWASFVPLYALAVAVFFVAERYRLPLFVPLCAGAGAAVDRFALAVASRRWRAVAWPAAITCVLALAVNWPLGLNDGRVDERLRLAKVLMNNRDYAGAARELDAVRQIDPANSTAEFNLGMALVSDGRAGEGIPHVRHAVDAGVPINGARYALVRALQVSGDTAGAVRLLRTFQPTPADNAESCLQVGYMAVDLDVADAAERFFRRAIVLQPQSPVARQQLGLLLASESRCTEALPELRASVARASSDSAARSALAFCESRARAPRPPLE